jgi:hypothetical protein
MSGLFPSRLRAQDDATMQHDHSAAPAQTHSHSHAGNAQMPGMEHQAPASQPSSFIDQILAHQTPGTSAEPNSVETPMIMMEKARWMFMFHGVAFINATQQSGPRGYDKVFSTSWFMPMAQRELGPGRLTLRTMVSLEPATVTQRFYPELFQQGETAFGKPINDGQHPHDFFMEVAGLYDWRLAEKTLLSFYAAPVGDPAMGPAGYPHRASASENPLAPLGHHLEDSTHIANDVVTAGIAYKLFRLEASGFHGREPDEFRWNIDSGRIDSWSARLSVQPGRNWSAQYSFAHLTSPEQLHPQDDVQRMTASVMYNRPLHRGSWSSTLLWGRNHVLTTGENFNGYLAESTLRFAANERVWTRIENVDRTNELLLGLQPEPPGFDERFLARVQAYTAGYDHDFHFIPGVATALGIQATLYAKPAFLTPIYRQHPAGVVVFARFRPRESHH